ncbi:MAG: nucleotidyl transferase AbiEii/AbiGii toxin family protein [bacterium]
MSEPDKATDYHDRGVQAVYSVLIEIGQVLGAWRDKFVIVGGAVPWLLLGHARPQHVGTLDIDIDLDPDALADGEYATLVEALEKKGYERNGEDLKPFQLRRWVQPDKGEPVAVLVDLLMPREARGDRNKHKRIEGLRVQRATGGEIALSEHVTQTLEGRMPDGRLNKVELLVASIPALLVMKGYALVGRDKKKDAYDIYFAIRNSAGGLEALAAECRRLLNNPVARKGYEHIAAKFRHEDDFGPQTVLRFMEDSEALGEMTPAQVQTDAFMQVSALLRGTGL